MEGKEKLVREIITILEAVSYEDAGEIIASVKKRILERQRIDERILKYDMA